MCGYFVFQRPVVPKAVGSGDSARVSSAPGSTGCSGGQGTGGPAPLAAQKAKLLEAHVPSLKRRRLSEDHGSFTTH